MWLAARGDVDAATRTAQQAMAQHDRLPMPFERARTQLLLGQLQRRQRLKEALTVSVGEALRAFEHLGTPLWAKRARDELARTKSGPTQHLRLTASEQRIAELAASGMTNRDVAAALFISPKTVEANLARLYRKLGIWFADCRPPAADRELPARLIALECRFVDGDSPAARRAPSSLVDW